MNAHEITTFLDEYLDIPSIEDDSNNGLQVETSAQIRKIGFAVDACMEVFQNAHHRGCPFVISHHGLIWGGIKYLRGDTYTRIKFLMDHDMGLYACHLPLDIHNEVGNNVQMARLLQSKIVGQFHPYKNITLGLLCQTDAALDDVTTIIRDCLGEYTLLHFGGDYCRKVGIVTGAGSAALDSAIELGCDTFITGETKHTSYHKAKENRMNVIFAGHYKTETLGIKALMEKVQDQFNTETVFIDSPTGL